MVFTSQIFVFYFLPLVLLGNYLLPVRARNTFLTLASYVFYGWWSPWFVGLMLFSTVLDYGCGFLITRPGASRRSRKIALITTITLNLALLAFFKYFGFAQENVNGLLVATGHEPLDVLDIVLPIGISFYTFETMSYSIDLYMGEAQRARRFTDFACFVSLFPHLVAGPIMRYRQLAAQLVERPQRGELFHLGVLGFMFGFAKKVLVANTVGEVADLCFEAGSLPWHAAWFGVIAYAFQIYFDFSGYSDMAIGIGRMLGFQIPVNFHSPYQAESITDFWRRWHISLSTWLRDYLYVPLGGNRGSALRTYRNLLLTMLLGGLWHGAQWTFVAWGAVHGVLLALERALGKQSPYAVLPRPLRIALTFVLVLFTWVLFRAEDLPHAGSMLAAMFTGRGEAAAQSVLAARVYEPIYLVVVALAAILVWAAPRTQDLVPRATRSFTLTGASFASFVLALVAMFAQAENPFLYFQF